MSDVKTEKTTLIDPSLDTKTEEELKAEAETKSNLEKEGLLKEIKKERDERHTLETKIAELEAKVNSPPTNSNQNDDELRLAVDRLAPILQEKGFITAAQKEDDDRAAKYAKDLEDLSKRYDGNDGRPAFDPSEVANYAKANGIFNLEAAYRDMHWNELVDWEKKQDKGDFVPTEKPSSSNPSRPSGSVPLTSDFLKKRMAEADGKEWYAKNRDKIIDAMSKGQLR
jgi:hypothetical protein